MIGYRKFALYACFAVLNFYGSVCAQADKEGRSIKEDIPDISEDAIRPTKPITQPKWKELLLDKGKGANIAPRVTYSVSGLFQVYGGTGKARTNVVSVAEEVRTQLIRELKEGAEIEVVTPIWIVLVGDPLKPEKIQLGERSPSPYKRRFGTKAGGGFFVELRINQSRKLTRENLKAAVLEMLLLERCLSVQKKVEDGVLPVMHAWVVDGLLEVMQWRLKKADRRHYAELAADTKLFKFGRLLGIKRKEIDKMDAATKRSYQAAAGAMVMAMLEQPSGLKGMKSMLQELVLFQGEMRNLLKTHFPEMNKGKNGERVAWLLQLNAMAMAPLTESLSIIETEKKLSELLRFRILDDEGNEQVFAIDDFEEFAKVEEGKRRAAIDGVSKRMVQLQYRCFPLYRPLLYQYGSILNSLSKGNTKEIGVYVKNLAAERALRRAAAFRARDYLNWYVIQNASGVDGNYGVFEVLKKTFEAKQKKKNSSLMGDYLDRLDAFYQ